jgi:hypothetical protein
MQQVSSNTIAVGEKIILNASVQFDRIGAIGFGAFEAGTGEAYFTLETFGEQDRPFQSWRWHVNPHWSAGGIRLPEWRPPHAIHAQLVEDVSGALPTRDFGPWRAYQSGATGPFSVDSADASECGVWMDIPENPPDYWVAEYRARLFRVIPCKRVTLSLAGDAMTQYRFAGLVGA